MDLLILILMLLGLQASPDQLNNPDYLQTNQATISQGKHIVDDGLYHVDDNGVIIIDDSTGDKE
jgi:hypothetical protein